MAQSMSIREHIEIIEEQTDFVFNYDVACADTLLVDFNFHEDYSIDNIESFFYHSPLGVKIATDQIVVLPLVKQKFKICGSIKSSYDESAFPFAGISIGNTQGGTSEEDGKFNFEVEAYKNEVVEFSYLGYNPKRMMIQEIEDCLTVFLDLNEDLISKEIIIKDYILRGISEGRTYGSFEFNLNEMAGNNEIVEQDVLKKVQLLPGIYSPDDSATNLNIRGSSSDHNLITWEGVNLYDNGHFFGMISSVNPFQLKDLRVYKSIHDPSLENRIGGVIEMNLTDEVKGPLSMSLGSNLTESHVNISAPLFNEKARVILGARSSLFEFLEDSPTLDSYVTKIFQGSQIVLGEDEELEDSVEQELEISFSDLNAKLIVDVSNKIKFQSSLLYSVDAFDYTSILLSDELESADTLSSYMLASSNKLSYSHSETDVSHLQVSYSEFESNSLFRISDLDFVQEFYTEELNNRIMDFSIRLLHQKHIGNHFIQGGYSFDKKDLENEYFETSDFEYERASEDYIQGAYHHLFLNDEFSLNKLNIQTGGRLSYAREQNNIRFSPRFSLRYKYNPDISLKAGAGIFHQYLRQVYDLGGNSLNLNSNFWTLPDEEDSTFLTSNKLTGGFVFNKNSWLIDVEAYYHHTKGLSAENPSVKNEFVLDDMGELMSSGVDILLSKRFNRFKSSIYYSLSQQVVRFPSLDLDEDEYFAANTDQRNVINWSNNYQFKNWTFQGIYQYRTGLPFTEIGEVVLIEDDEMEENFEHEIDEINESRLQDYHRIDLAVNYRYQWKEFNAEAGLSLLNVSNRENIQSRKFTLADTDELSEEPETLQIEKYQLPRTLMMHIRVFF